MYWKLLFISRVSSWRKFFWAIGKIFGYFSHCRIINIESVSFSWFVNFWYLSILKTDPMKHIYLSEISETENKHSHHLDSPYSLNFFAVQAPLATNKHLMEVLLIFGEEIPWLLRTFSEIFSNCLPLLSTRIMDNFYP